MDWRYNTIWFEQIDQDKLYQQDFKDKLPPPTNFNDAEYAIIWHLKSKELSFDNLPESDKLLYLELNWANLKDFRGINKFKNLKRLELHFCTKLENAIGIKPLKDTLEFLHVDHSKKFVQIDELLQLKNLKVLRLNSCGPISDLGFLKHFPKLIDFRFVDTNIVNGDLSPVLEHPTIKTVGFSNKRHYNYTSKQVKSALDLKLTNASQHYTDKGGYQTFRYDYE
jgi:hypothetical protein